MNIVFHITLHFAPAQTVIEVHRMSVRPSKVYVKSKAAPVVLSVEQLNDVLQLMVVWVFGLAQSSTMKTINGRTTPAAAIAHEGESGMGGWMGWVLKTFTPPKPQRAG